MRPADGPVAEGYDDGVDVGPGDALDKIRITGRWEDDVALGRPHTVSRASAPENPDTGGAELTDGVVIPPTTYRTSTYVQGQVAYWAGDDPLVITVDLGAEQPVQAIRVTSHQPDLVYGHAGTIAAVAVAADGSSTQLGVIQHDDVFSPPGDHLDWGYWRSGDYADLPAEGRLAYGYWLVLDAPVPARELRLAVLPLAGHGVGLSEIQAFSSVVVSDWPDHDVDLGGGAVSVPQDDPRVPAAPTRLGVAPNPANPGTVISYDVPRATRVVMRVVDVRGRVVRTLVDGWRPAGAHRAFWDGRDGDGREAASGVYLAVCEGEGWRVVGAVTLVR
ncbi:MAG: FlgD immunoglobulin-like domain containing protein [Candidatus Krumholzibacteriia bacterium]